MNWSQQSVLVTGGGGFIGSHLVAKLIQLGASVSVVTRSISENLPPILPRIQVVQSDLGEALRDNHLKLGDYDLIFHLSGNPYVPPSVDDPVYDYNMNLHTTFHFLEQLRHQKRQPRFVYASSAAVYGNPKHMPVREDSPTFPLSPYGVSKLASEQYLAVYSQLYGLRGSSLRMFSVYGPGQHKQVVFDILKKLHANPRQIEVLGNGSQARDFCYISDVIQAMLVVAESAPGQGEVYNVASGESHSIGELVQILCRMGNVQPEIRFTGQIRQGETERWTVDISAICSIGFQPKVTFEEGLRQVKAWYEQTFR
jgi:UDP-glucose 4-epimerase